MGAAGPAPPPAARSDSPPIDDAVTKKLTLRVETLEVQSFQVQPGARSVRGTVHGNAIISDSAEPLQPIGTRPSYDQFCTYSAECMTDDTCYRVCGA